ncbi:S-layer homology domain-containing protein [Collinsella tanakaei]|uniref:S-layer homology domain-containing protein n=1 Tax=Collinsella tanakaei TaxID=626935 RepID=UPI00195C16BA|nr:S-layer homology domain-containing protein [Collinsella tanakaei]MBM6779887.1 S-layer homology domain-containing protein [Collinsella tanakaei]
MTACVNRKHTKKVAAVVTASLVGALSLGVAPVAAMAEEIDLQATITPDTSAWNKATFDYSVDADIDGKYVTTVGDYMTVQGVKTVDGRELGPSDYTVVYFAMSGSAPDDTDVLVNATTAATVSKRDGGVPNAVGNYFVAIVEGSVDISTLDSTKSYNDLKTLAGVESIHVQAFEIKAASEDFGDMGAYEYDASASDKGLSDTTLTYKGSALSIGVSMDGKRLTNEDAGNFTYKITSAPRVTGTAPSVVKDRTAAADGIAVFTLNNAVAGDYTVRITGAGDYAGKTADVTFTVAPVDLDSAVLSMEPVDDVTGLMVTGSGPNYSLGDNTLVKFDGASVDAADIEVTLNAYNDVLVTEAAVSPVGNKLTQKGKYTFKVSASTAASDNVIGGPVLVDVYVADETVTYKYSGSPISGDADMPTFLPSANFPFNPGNLTAFAGTKAVPFTYTVTKDGEEVTSYDEPGEYVLELVTDPDNGFNYAGHKVVKFQVQGTTVDFGTVGMFVFVDNKDLGKGNDYGSTPYTGSEIEPVVALTNKDGALEQGVDYTVSYEDEDGNAVESITEPGKYTIVATLADTDETEIPFTLTVTQAAIVTAKPTADFFATDGETAAAPSFTGSTNNDFDKGTKFDLPADQISVRYYELDDADGNGKIDDADIAAAKKGAPVDADDLTEDGWYVADINVLTSSKTLTGSATCAFQVSKTAGFSDVDASAWYAPYVYEAKDLTYMSGIAGTNLFMPLSDISRAELAQVFFNMAGQSTETGKYFPTQFGDVDGWAWYAQPVDWAARAGVVTGYDADTFGPTDKASRQQVAVMLYRYAKAQGKDVSVDDADAALAAYKDGDQVADWAKDAMAWAVENGVFGVDTDELYPTENIQRAAVAAITVRFQPEQLKK